MNLRGRISDDSGFVRGVISDMGKHTRDLIREGSSSISSRVTETSRVGWLMDGSSSPAHRDCSKTIL
jgi:hypothetical protein